jgi:hypothetical protein
MAKVWMWLGMCAVLLGVSVVPAAAQFGPGFFALTHFDGGCSPASNQFVSSPTPPAAAGATGVPCVSGLAAAAGEAGVGTVRASSDTLHACCGSGSAAQGRARIQLDNVVISGPPAASIPISLNFALRGTLNSSADFGQAGLMLYVALRGGSTNLEVDSEIFLSPSLVVHDGIFADLNEPFPNVTIDRSFTTHVVNALPNQPMRLEIDLTAWSTMAGMGSTATDFFSGTNGFSLPVGIPVFNLPEGYTIHIPELDIVDNLWRADAPPSVSVTPEDLNFGIVTQGQPSTQLVTVTNTGGPGLQVSEVRVLPMASPFSVTSLRKGGAATTLPVVLDTNETLDVEIAFTTSTTFELTSLLLVVSNDPDNGQVTVQLSGRGAPIQPPPPSAQIAGLLSFFDFSATAGTLQGDGPGKSATGRLKALRNMIQTAADFISESNIVEACRQFQDVLDRIDGNPRPPEFASGPAIEELRSRVIELRGALGCQ